jgi:hypothetical protein
MGGGRGEDVPPVEGVRVGLEPVSGIRQLDRLLDAAEAARSDR